MFDDRRRSMSIGHSLKMKRDDCNWDDVPSNNWMKFVHDHYTIHDLASIPLFLVCRTIIYFSFRYVIANDDKKVVISHSRRARDPTHLPLDG